MKSSDAIVVTGIGVVSPFGLGAKLYWDSLVDGVSAVRPVESFDATPFRGKVAAEVPRAIYESTELRELVGNPEEDSAYFAALAAREALLDAGLPLRFSDEDQVGCVLGTLCGGVRNQERYCRAFLFEEGARPATGGSPESIIVSHQLNYLVERFNLTGPSSLISTACASTTDAIGMGMDLIRNGECQRVIVGGGDVLGEVVHGGFNSVFSITPTYPRPFDETRDGFAIGEGAAMMVIESLASAQARGARIYAVLPGYGLSNTAFHLTATSDTGEGEGLAVKRALADAGLMPSDVDYVNAHGTATPHNDATEAKAIRSVFQEHAPNVRVSSIKPMIGHCMGAAGAFEAVATVLTVYHGCIPPTINTAGDQPDITFNLVKDKAVHVPVRHAISESFGFGGACSCIVVSRADQPVSRN